jgi:hypothetical protein
VSQHQHDFIGGTTPQFNQEALGDTGGLFNTSVDGTQLEWFVPASLLGQGASVYASTLTAAPSPGNVTYDITQVALVTPVPEPTSMALLVLGVIALGLRRKRS